MFETVVVATDGSDSAKRGVRAALDLAGRFDATVHALYVVDEGDIKGSPDEIRDDLETALQTAGEDALAYVESQGGTVETAVKQGKPADEIISYAEDIDADLVSMGTRGRNGDHAFLLGSVAEAVVRRAPMPVLTVRQLDDEETNSGE